MVLEKSTRFCTQIRTPITPIIPYRMIPAPPSTPAGMVLISAPNFGRKARARAVVPATQYAAVE